jgi:hypothetical protein
MAIRAVTGQGLISFKVTTLAGNIFVEPIAFPDLLMIKATFTEVDF